jgi:hypothetical protein
MSDSIQTRTRIDPHDDHEVRDWAERFDVTAEQLQNAVQAVGGQVADVELYLKGSRSSSNAEKVAKS